MKRCGRSTSWPKGHVPPVDKIVGMTHLGSPEVRKFLGVDWKQVQLKEDAVSFSVGQSGAVESRWEWMDVPSIAVRLRREFCEMKE
ncbi:hypothetical protein AVEN_157453-1 [Araneus ventricosus]|uniref:Uncharacterized protein n=1 Tax=Araneus ventricosus TaxID=182803 RepID=A0A4Y2PU21_ARAVE|nr:hypothetical protein AVEN_157453-1 [Araneus ventricosus]